MFYILARGQYMRQTRDEYGSLWTHKREKAWKFESEKQAQEILEKFKARYPKFYEDWDGNVKVKFKAEK